MTEPEVRVVLYGASGARSSVTWCASVERARSIVDEAPREDVLARVRWPDGRELELCRPGIGERWVITGRRRAA